MIHTTAIECLRYGLSCRMAKRASLETAVGAVVETRCVASLLYDEFGIDRDF